MDKKLTKRLLRNETCDNCYARKWMIRHDKTDWCFTKICRPEENTCEYWVISGVIKKPGMYYAR